MKEYRTIREVSGPLMVVDQVEGVTYDELGEIQLHDGTIVEKTILPPMTAEQDARAQEIKQAIWDLAKTEFSKFVMGQRPMEEYDAFIEQLIGLGAQEWADILNEAEAEFQADMAAK